MMINFRKSALVTVGSWFAVASLFGQGETPPADNIPEEPQQEVRIVKLMLAPVGPIKLAKFGAVKQRRSKVTKQEPTTAQADGQAEEQPEDQEQAPPDSNEAAGGNTAFGVLETPKDERPPSEFWIRVSKDDFKRVSCSLNSISQGLEVPLPSEELVLYEREIDPESGKPKYSEYHSLKIPPGNRSILITIAKPFKTRKWTKPIISAHDLTAAKAGSITVINTSAEQKIGCKIGDKQALLPLERGRLTYLPDDGKPVAKVSLYSPNGMKDESTKEPLPFMDGFFPLKKRSKTLFLVYTVSNFESKKGAKYVRATIDL